MFMNAKQKLPSPFDATSPRNYSNYPHIPYISRNYNHLHFAADSMGLSSFNFFLVGSIIRFLRNSTVQGHPRSLTLVAIESAYATSY